MSEKRCGVYGLVDPETGAIRYVGASTDIGRRYRAHLSGSDTNQGKNTWIRELKAKGQRPGVVVLENTTHAALQSREFYWLDLYTLAGLADLNIHQKQTKATKLLAENRKLGEEVAKLRAEIRTLKSHTSHSKPQVTRVPCDETGPFRPRTPHLPMGRCVRGLGVWRSVQKNTS